eukprot:EG_transcript_25922
MDDEEGHGPVVCALIPWSVVPKSMVNAPQMEFLFCGLGQCSLETKAGSSTAAHGDISPPSTTIPSDARPDAEEAVIQAIRRHAGSVSFLQRLQQQLLTESTALPPRILHALLRAYMNLRRLDCVDELLQKAEKSPRTVPLICRAYKTLWRAQCRRAQRGDPRPGRRKPVSPMPRL